MQDVISMTVNDMYSGVLQIEKPAMEKFSKLAKQILNEPMTRNFVDIIRCPKPGTSSGDPDDLSDLIQLWQDYMKSNKERQPELASMVTMFESEMRALAGDTTTSGAVLSSMLAQESLSSNASTNWERLADVHLTLYNLAVVNTDKPDYKNGLVHLDEMWKLHHGIGVLKRQLCHQHLQYAQCYNALGRTGEAGKAMLEVVVAAPDLR